MSLTPLSIAFQGAARTVTGSRHLLRFGERSWLFDCGIYQGHREEADAVNRTFRFPPADLDAVVVSHAHLDHVGNLPTIVVRGFDGPIHATPATADLARVMLADSAFLMERDVDHLRRHRHRAVPAEPLYRPADVERTLERFKPHDYHQSWSLFDGVDVRADDAGHLLGSALTTFTFRSNGRTLRLGMSGDLGRAHRPILRDPEHPAGVDVLVLESTYGDRLHPPEGETERTLAEVVRRTLARGGRVLVPSFAVGRAQELVVTLHRLIERGALPDVPIFVDSPMAKSATAIYQQHPECFDDEARQQFEHGDGAPFGFARLRYVSSPEESKALNDRHGPCIILAASGMCEGGRILHHLQHGLGNPDNTVLFVGYQADGTLGRRLRDGAEDVMLLGVSVRRRAEVVGLDGFSAHADQRELIEWVARLDPAPKRIFLVHGDLEPANVLAERLRERIGAEVRVPEKNETVELWN
jgi:metallo-beta-lactamase family protein